MTSIFDDQPSSCGLENSNMFALLTEPLNADREKQAFLALENLVWHRSTSANDFTITCSIVLAGMRKLSPPVSSPYISCLEI